MSKKQDSSQLIRFNGFQIWLFIGRGSRIGSELQIQAAAVCSFEHNVCFILNPLVVISSQASISSFTCQLSFLLLHYFELGAYLLTVGDSNLE